MAQTYAFRIQAEGLEGFRAQIEAAARSNESLASAWERLRTSSPQLTTALEQARQTSDRVTTSLASQTRELDKAGEGARNLTGKIGQAGFQIQDFAVQVQGGTSAMTAFSQQGSQLLGAFGPGGAIAGAALTVGLLVTQIIAGRDATTQMNDAIKAQADAYKLAEGAAKQWRDGLADETKRVVQLRDYYASLSDARRSYEGRAIQAQQGTMTQAQEDLRAQLTTVIRERVAPGVPATDIMGNATGGEVTRSVVGGDVARYKQVEDALATLRGASRLTEDDLAKLSTRMVDIAGQGMDEFSKQLRAAATELDKQGPRVREISEAIKALDERYRALTGALNENERAQEQGRAGMSEAALAQITADAALVQARIQALRSGGLDELEKVNRAQQEQAEILKELTKQLADYEKALRQAGMAEAQIAEAVAKAKPEYQARISDIVINRSTLEAETKAAEEVHKNRERMAREAERIAKAAAEAAGRNASALDETWSSFWDKTDQKSEERTKREAERAEAEAKAFQQRQAAAVEQFRQTSQDAVGRLAENAFDRLGTGLVNAFLMGEKGAVNFANVARSLFASVAADVAKLALVNPISNSILGSNRPTIDAAMSGGGGSMLSGLGGSIGGISNSLGLGSISGGLNNFTGLLGGFGQVNSNYAPSIAGMSTSEGIASLPANPTQGLSAFGGAGLGMGIGMAGGSIVGSMRGSVNASQNAIIGSALGTGLGYLVGGPMGAAIGGSLGGIASGFLGPTKAGMAARSGGDVGYGIGPNGQLIVNGSGGNRWDAAASVGAIQGQLDAMNQQAVARGLTFSQGTGVVGFGAASRNPTSIDMAGLRLSSTNATVNTALANAGGFQQQIAAADFVTQTYEALTKPERIAAFRASIDSLTQTYDAAIGKARELGLSEASLVEQRDARINRLNEDRQAALTSVDANLMQRRFTLGGNSQAASLTAFDEQARQELRTLKDTLFGLGMEGTQDYADRIARLEQTIADERLAVIKQYGDAAVAAETSKQQAMASASRGLLEQLTFGGMGGLSPEAQYFSGLQALNQSKQALAANATPETISDFSRVAQSVLPVARSFLGTSERYAGLVADVAGTLRGAAPGGDPANLAAVLEMQAGGMDRVEAAILSTGQSSTETLQLVVSELRRLTSQNEALLRRIAA
jgi:hypothetical protein